MAERWEWSLGVEVCCGLLHRPVCVGCPARSGGGMLSASRDPRRGRARVRPGGVARPGAWGLAARSAALFT